MSNAVKFSHRDSKISVYSELEQRPDGVHLIAITVVDSGIGLSQEDQNNLFQPFYKSKDQTSVKMNPNGNGLGLYMSKQICIAAGGDLKLTS